MTVIKLVGPVSKDSHSVRRMQSEQHAIYQEQKVKMTKTMLTESFKLRCCKTVVLMSTIPCTKPIQQCLLETRKLHANVDWILPLSCEYPILTRIVQLVCAKPDVPFLGLLHLNPKKNIYLQCVGLSWKLWKAKRNRIRFILSYVRVLASTQDLQAVVQGLILSQRCKLKFIFCEIYRCVDLQFICGETAQILPGRPHCWRF